MEAQTITAISDLTALEATGFGYSLSYVSGFIAADFFADYLNKSNLGQWQDLYSQWVSFGSPLNGASEHFGEFMTSALAYSYTSLRG